MSQQLDKYSENGWLIPVLTMADLELDEQRCGLKGSPTKVHKIKSITLAGGELKIFDNKPANIKDLVNEIMKEYVEVG